MQVIFFALRTPLIRALLLFIALVAQPQPAAQAQERYASFGGRFTEAIPAKKTNFKGPASEILTRCEAFNSCTAARLRGKKVMPVSKDVRDHLMENGFRAKNKKDRTFFTKSRRTR